MDIESFREFCLSLGDVTEKTPFGKFAKRYESILVFYILGHMFCFIDMDDFTFVTVKSTPDEIEELRLNHLSLSNPINQSLRHWIQLNLDGDISDGMIYKMVSHSYDLVKQKYTKKNRKIRNKPFRT